MYVGLIDWQSSAVGLIDQSSGFLGVSYRWLEGDMR